MKAYTLFDRDIEYVIDDNKIKIVDEQTGRIMEGRRYSDGPIVTAPLRPANATTSASRWWSLALST